MADPVQQLVAEGPQRERVDPFKCRCAREHKGWTQRQLADAMGYASRGHESVSRIEAYQKFIGPRTLARLAEALDRKPQDFMSSQRVFERNRKVHDEWREAGCPALTEWLRKR